MQLLIVRHGQPLCPDLVLGRSPVGLSHSGIAQAGHIASRLVTFHPDQLYSSDLARARHTAAVIGARLDLSCNVVPDLAERDYGSWELCSRPQIAAQYPELYRSWLRNPAATTPPEGEPYDHLMTRTVRACRLLQGHRAVVVAHLGTIRALLSHLLDFQPSTVRRLAIDYASLTIAASTNWGWTLTLLNDTCHLGSR